MISETGPKSGQAHEQQNMRIFYEFHIDGLVQERRNSSAFAMELRLSCTNPSTYD